jgi:UDP-N-acetylmuramate-alanine ligase
MRGGVLPEVFGRAVRRVHCVGVAGMGLGPLAIFLAEAGFEVSGEDDAMTPEMAELLAKAGVRVGAMGDDCEAVVYSSAIAAAHPVYRLAKERGLLLARRGEMLAEVVRGRKLVAVCGSHGKTTTTAMLVWALRRAKLKSGYVLGGLLADGSAPASAGENEWVVAEIDESDGTIERFSPEITVAVNLDWDHPDRYRTAEEIERTFVELFGRTRGMVLMNEAWGGEVGTRSATFGRNGDFPGEVEKEEEGRMVLRLGGRFAVGRAVVRAKGEFNATNAIAALAAAQVMGVNSPEDLLADFGGVRRRQTVLWEAEGIRVIEDYAHHPAEIRALLGSLRAQAGRLVVVFQPHRYSRTKQFLTEFAEALSVADRVVLLDVYGAGEGWIEGGTTADLHAVMGGERASHVVNDGEFFAVLEEVRAGDLVAFVGAGDIDRKARAWVARRKGQR